MTLPSLPTFYYYKRKMFLGIYIRYLYILYISRIEPAIDGNVVIFMPETRKIEPWKTKKRW